MSRPWQVALILVACALALAACAQTDFYDASPAELAGKPGTLIRSEALPHAPKGASAYRVLYRSTGLDGKSVAVSGVVIIPDSARDGTPGPVVAWAHPTTGVVPRCAPSLALFLFQQISGLRAFIDSGYIIAATDYPGLGTAGPHPFLVGESEGRAVLDMVRAAQALAYPDASGQVALWGHSQGGQAALFAAQLASTYAPELDVVAVAAAAPATDLRRLMQDDVGTPGGDNLLAMTLWSWSRIYGLPLTAVVDPAALPVIDELAEVCLESPVDIWPRRTFGHDLMERFLLDPKFASHEPWRRLLAENTAGALPAALPVFLAQGTADDTVRPDVTLAYAEQLCHAGSKVTYLSLPGVGHGLVGHDAIASLGPWLGDRFAGRSAPDSCSSLQ